MPAGFLCSCLYITRPRASAEKNPGGAIFLGAYFDKALKDQRLRVWEQSLQPPEA